MRYYALLFFDLAILTVISPSESEESEELVSESELSLDDESLEEALESELEPESIVARLTFPFLDFLLFFFFFRVHLRELCPVLLQLEQCCCPFIAFLMALAT